MCVFFLYSHWLFQFPNYFLLYFNHITQVFFQYFCFENFWKDHKCPGPSAQKGFPSSAVCPLSISYKFKTGGWQTWRSSKHLKSPPSNFFFLWATKAERDLVNYLLFIQEYQCKDLTCLLSVWTSWDGLRNSGTSQGLCSGLSSPPFALLFYTCWDFSKGYNPSLCNGADISALV